MFLLGLDVGSTGCKAAVFDADGVCHGFGYREYDIETDETGKAEQDADKIWDITKEVAAQTIHSSGSKEIKAIAVSVQGDSSIPVDKNFNPLSKALLGMDYRSAPQAERFAEKLGNIDLFKKTGMRSHPLNAAVKTAWLKETSPNIYEKAHKIVTYADFILGKLGAEPTIDFSMASRSGVFDLEKREWSGEIIEAFGLDKEKFSRPCASGLSVGRIAPKMAEFLGVSKDVMLVTGGHDQTCAGIGAGLISEGPALLSTGTAEVLSTAFDRPRLTDVMYESYYPCYIHAKPEMYFTFALNHVGGVLLKWYRDNLGRPEGSYESIINNVPEGPSRVMVLPHFNGSGTPWCDMDSKGAIVGMSMSTTRHDIVRAILESQTYELRINVERMGDAGIPVSGLIAAGGGAKSSLWLQIRADVLNCPVRTLRVREAACLGAAILAGTAAGVYASIDEGVKKTVAFEKEYKPRSEMTEKYEERYQLYQELYPTMRTFNRKL